MAIIRPRPGFHNTLDCKQTVKWIKNIFDLPEISGLLLSVQVRKATHKEVRRLANRLGID